MTLPKFLASTPFTVIYFGLLLAAIAYAAR